MQFSARNIMRPLCAFLQTCPLLQAGTEIGAGDYGPDETVAGNVLVYTGAAKPLEVRTDVQGNVYLLKQSNFNLFSSRRPWPRRSI